MGLNVGYLKADRTKEGDEQYTPYYAAWPILKYIPNDMRIWTPFDREWSAFYQLFKENGYMVVRSDLSDGLDFFTYEPPKYDCIVSNPPFSQKSKVLKRLYELGKPFAMLLPLTSLQSIDRYKYFNQGIQILAFDKRIAFHNPQSMGRYKKGVSFAAVYFCRDILPRDLIMEELEEFEKPLVG